MSNPRCGKCGKTVYPVEKLNCLDKFWHKGCFRCEVCHMALTMKNYKGHNKLPYCNAIIEEYQKKMQLMAVCVHTDIRTTIKYHSDFERGKGKVLSVVDDPETMRIRKNTGIQSQTTYHGHHDTKYMMEARRPLKDEDGVRQPRQAGHHPGSLEDYDPIRDLEAVSQPPRRVGSIDNYNPLASDTTRTTSYKMQLSTPVTSPSIHNSSQPPPPQTYQPPPQTYQPPPQTYQPPPQTYDPPPQTYQPPTQTYQPPPQKYQPPPQTYDPPPQTYQPPPQTYQPPPQDTYQPPPQTYQPPPPVEQYEPPPPVQSYAPPVSQSQAKSRGLCYQAIYDYTAAEADEVTFLDGDILINCEIIDAGWMTGTNERTGDTGMLPSNYVEPL
ncbi:LIM and SH3 domain protein 1-like [Saccoglossus kowalevskii]|uniref:LIM and SH3 domain protein 1-like n=1 Tax=Saccoglossus kowalevskii TaxID=10224 RepID=A0ABM0MWI4_SACKO|nr:PREDICTED: LIM and SH3 domain protein 1-like [Saccoglossus kowalevskii]